MKCGVCKFYSATQSRQSALRPIEGVGECRRHAPRGPVALAWSTGTGGGGDFNSAVMSPFPFVPADDWCGDFEKRT